MDAAISGAAKIAWLVDKDGMFSIDLDAPGTIVSRRPSEFHVLLGAAHDLEFVADVDRDEVLRRLEAASRREDALRKALTLLDGLWSAKLRRQASVQLEDLLATGDIHEYVKSVLYSLRLPEGASPQSAMLLAEGDRVRALLSGLIRAQAGIERARASWDDAAASTLDDPRTWIDARAQAVRDGLFPRMVATLEEAERIGTMKPDARIRHGAIPAAARVLEGWTASLEQHWQRLGKVRAEFWSYLTVFRSVDPADSEDARLPVLEWPTRPKRAAPAAPENPLPFETARSRRLRQFGGELGSTAHILRRRRRAARAIRGATGITGVLAAALGSAVLLAFVTIAMEFSVSRWLLVTALVALAGFVFRLLDRVFGSSIALARATAEYQSLQAEREEFELRWARQLAPLARQSMFEAGATTVGRFATEAEVPFDAGSGILHVQVDEPPGVVRRQLHVTLPTGTSVHTLGVVTPLVLRAGQYLVDLSGVTADGRRLHSQVAAIVLPDEIANVRVTL